MRMLKTGLQAALLTIASLWSFGQAASATTPDVLWSQPNTVPKQIIFSPDSQTAVVESGCDPSVHAVGGCHSDAYVWNVREGKQLFKLPAAGIPTHFTPDGQAVYTDDQGRTIRTVKAWRVANGQYVGDVVADAGPSGNPIYPNFIDGFSSDDRFYVVNSYEVHQTDGAKLLTTLYGKGPYTYSTWAFSPSGNIITNTYSVRPFPKDIPVVCDFISLGGGMASPLFTAPGYFVAMTPDDRFALVYDAGARLKEGQIIQGPQVITLWDVSKGQLVQSWPISLPSDATNLPLTSFARFTASGQVVLTPPASSSSNGHFQIIGEKIGSSDPAYSLTLSNAPLFATDNRYFGSFENGVFTVRDADTGEIVRTDEGRILATLPSRTTTPTQLSPDGRTLVLNNSLFWSLDTGSMILVFQPLAEPLGFSSDSQQLAVRSNNSDLGEFYDAEDGRYLHSLNRTDQTSNPSSLGGGLSPDWQIYAYSPSPDILWWNVVSGSLVGDTTLASDSPRFIYSFSADSHLLALAYETANTYGAPTLHRLLVIDSRNYTQLANMDTLPAKANFLAFSPDSQYLATADDDNLTRVWRLSDHALVYTLEGPHSLITSLSFLADSESLAIGYADQTLRLWKLPEVHPYRTLEGFQLLPDGSAYLSRSENDLLFHRFTDGTVYQTYEGLGNTDFRFSPDSRLMAYQTSDALQVARVPAPPAGLSGDLNGDESVDIRDAQLALLIAVGGLQPSEAQAQAGDLDADGRVTVSDVVLILQFATGLRDTVPLFALPVPLSDSFDGQDLSRFWKQKQPLPASAVGRPGFTTLPWRHLVSYTYKPASPSELLTSADHDIWQGVWEPAFLYQDQLTGNFSMRLYVQYISSCDDLSAVGLMVSQSVPDRTNSSSEIPTWGLIQMTFGYGIEAKWGGQGLSQSTLTATTRKISHSVDDYFYGWVRLDRQGSVLTYYSSTDGKTWKQEGIADLSQMPGVTPLTGPIAAGIEMQAHCGEKQTIAIVDDFQVEPLP